MRRLRILCRSGRTSKVDGGGRVGVAGWGGGSAGVAEPVGGTEARADTGAWGVGAADIARVAGFAIEELITPVLALGCVIGRPRVGRTELGFGVV